MIEIEMSDEDRNKGALKMYLDIDSNRGSKKFFVVADTYVIN